MQVDQDDDARVSNCDVDFLVPPNHRDAGSTHHREMLKLETASKVLEQDKRSPAAGRLRVISVGTNYQPVPQ